MKFRSGVFNIMIFATLLYASQVQAFSCMRPTPEQTLKLFDAVIIGKIISAEKAFGPEVTPPDGYMSARLSVKVVNSYKSLNPDQNINVDVKYNPISMDREPVFREGEEFFFPLGFDKAKGRYELKTTCSPYFLLDAKSKFLIELKK